MILTVTLNAALDVTYRIDRLRPHRTHRVSTVVVRPGGKGVNVATVLTQLREPAVATGLAGGGAGGALRAGLSATGVRHAFVPVAEESRRTVTVVDDADATGFWEPGPVVSAAEWAAFRTRYRGLLTVCRAVVLAGSLPPGVPADAYRELVALAREHAVPSVVDAEGPALGAALAARPDIVKPNLAELASVTGSTPATRQGILAGAGLLREAGAGAVVVSRGRRGLLASTVDGQYRAAPPRATGNPTGAGDAAVAALARGLANGTPWPTMLADAVALSAVAVAAPAAGLVDEPTYDRLRHTVTAKPVEE